MTTSKASKFQKGSGCFTCIGCDKKTRSTGRGDNENSRLCERCFDMSGDENAVSDGDMTRAEFDAKWNQPKPARKSRKKVSNVDRISTDDGQTWQEVAVVEAQPTVTIIEEQLGDGTVISVEPSSLPTIEAAVAPPVVEEQIKTVPISTDFLALGHAAALAELASAKGMTVKDVLTLPQVLSDAGLPTNLLQSVISRANRFYRDAIDGMMFRCNRPLSQPAPELTASEVIKVTKPQAKVQAQASDQAVIEEFNAVRTPKTNRNTLFGFAATAIIRWLGKQGASFDTAKQVLEGNGLAGLSDSTIKIQLRAGVKGDRGEPANLTEEQAKQLLG